jgi:hypothetical protein
VAIEAAPCAANGPLAPRPEPMRVVNHAGIGAAAAAAGRARPVALAAPGAAAENQTIPEAGHSGGPAGKRRSQGLPKKGFYERLRLWG